jgi:hypothetical protein
VPVIAQPIPELALNPLPLEQPNSAAWAAYPAPLEDVGDLSCGPSLGEMRAVQASARSRPIVVWLTPNVRAMSVSASPASRLASASRR